MAMEIDSVEVPSYAQPRSNGYQFFLPETTGKSGLGKPVGAAGKAWAVITFSTATETCWNYWAGKTGEATYLDLTSVKLWNPWKSGGADWETFSGGAVLHRPTYQNIRFGNYIDVEILITEIE